MMMTQFTIQGYLAHEKQRPQRTLQYDYVGSFGGPGGGGLFLMSEAPLYIFIDDDSIRNIH